MIRVACLINNLGSGGAQRQVLELVRRLDRGRVDPCIWVYHPDQFYLSDPRYADIPLRTVPKRGKLDPLLPLRLARMLAEDRIDVIHAFLLTPGAWALAAARLSRRRVAVVQSERTAVDAGIAGWTNIRRATYPRSDLVIANSERAARLIVSTLDVPAERVVAVPNGIETAHWRAPAAPDPELDAALAHVPPGTPILAAVASFHHWKDPQTLVRALARLRAGGQDRFFAVLAGSAEHPEVLGATMGMIAREGLERHVIRLSPRKDVRALYQRADALVLSSRFEGFPNVVLEGMASGLPIFASDVSDLASFLRDGVHGHVFPVGDDEDLALALSSFLGLARSRRRAMGAACRKLVEERYTLDAMVDATTRCYERLIV